jgi:uncharacterized protein YlxW (UPF0749 family)
MDTIEDERREGFARARRDCIEAAKRAEAERVEAEKRAEQERQEKLRQLQAEKSALNAELSNLKGLFTGKRRKEIETRLAQIDTELKKCNGGILI